MYKIKNANKQVAQAAACPGNPEYAMKNVA
jgi:hypothetical protein